MSLKDFLWRKRPVRDALRGGATAREIESRTAGLLARIKALAGPAKCTETFGAAVRRRGLSERDLQVVFAALRKTHLALYGIGGLLLIASAFVSAATGSVLIALPALALTASAFVLGYLTGFRAYQIQQRRLMPLAEALRDFDSYLILE